MASKKSMQAAAATTGLFVTEEVEAKPQKVKTKTEPEAPQDPKRETVTFSVKIDTDTLKRWRIYTSLDGYGDKGKMTEAALNEYMDSHKLTPEKQAKFDTLYEL